MIKLFFSSLLGQQHLSVSNGKRLTNFIPLSTAEQFFHPQETKKRSSTFIIYCQQRAANETHQCWQVHMTMAQHRMKAVKCSKWDKINQFFSCQQLNDSFTQEYKGDQEHSSFTAGSQSPIAMEYTMDHGLTLDGCS